MLYRASYDSKDLRGKDDPNIPRPWNIIKILNKDNCINKKLLDLGTGTGFKLLPIQSKFKKIIGIEISKSMVNAARRNLPFDNIEIIQANNFELPFPDNYFDVVVSFLAPCEFSEIHRVVKKDGYILLEKVGCEDKKELKDFFGEDELGKRGQYSQYTLADYLNLYHEEGKKYFEFTSIKNGYWNTYYSAKGLLKLLSNTPVIRDYNYKRDKEVLKKAIEKLSTPNGIIVQQNRVLIHARNPK
jgi:SAM-dependent methyltransferase